MPLFDAADRQASCIREWHFSIFTLMKRIRCPKCDEAILFDDSLYTPGRTLVFECPTCRKQFKIRVGVKAATSNNAEQDFDSEQNEEERLPLGHLVVVENAFHLRQEIPLFLGKNSVGRHVKGTKANAAFKTVDPSVDQTHCHITVTVNKNGNKKFVLRDGPSGTGTFHMNELVGLKESVNVEDGAIITLGATTLILRDTPPNETEE